MQFSKLCQTVAFELSLHHSLWGVFPTMPKDCGDRSEKVWKPKHFEKAHEASLVTSWQTETLTATTDAHKAMASQKSDLVNWGRQMQQAVLSLVRA